MSMMFNLNFFFRHETEKKQAELGVMNTISRKILVLGAGKVSSPFIEYHTRNPGTSVTVGKFLIASIVCAFQQIVSLIK